MGPVVVSLLSTGCGDDGSGDDPSETAIEAGVDTSSGAQTDADAAFDAAVTTTSTSSGQTSSAVSSTSGSSTWGIRDAGIASDAGSDLADASVVDESSDVQTSGASTSTTSPATATTTQVSSNTGIEDPTSEEVPTETEFYWDQMFFHGHADAIGTTTVLRLEGDQLCFSGNESGTVGFWYNVNQSHGGEAEPFNRHEEVTGLNVDVATDGEYEMHFYAGDVLYCSGIIEGGWRYFLWASFRDCTDLVSFYDGQASLTTLRFTYLADGEFDVCLNRLESGRATDGGVQEVGSSDDAGTSSGSESSTGIDSNGGDAGSQDAGLAVDASTADDAALP